MVGLVIFGIQNLVGLSGSNFYGSKAFIGEHFWLIG